VPTRRGCLGHGGRPRQGPAVEVTAECDVGQGFYLGRPMDGDEIGRLLGDDVAAADRKPATTG
jgi:hypothetical protein